MSEETAASKLLNGALVTSDDCSVTSQIGTIAPQKENVAKTAAATSARIQNATPPTEVVISSETLSPSIAASPLEQKNVTSLPSVTTTPIKPDVTLSEPNSVTLSEPNMTSSKQNTVVPSKPNMTSSNHNVLTQPVSNAVTLSKPNNVTPLEPNIGTSSKLTTVTPAEPTVVTSEEPTDNSPTEDTSIYSIAIGTAGEDTEICKKGQNSNGNQDEVHHKLTQGAETSNENTPRQYMAEMKSNVPVHKGEKEPQLDSLTRELYTGQRPMCSIPPMNKKAVRIFISSTFSDTKEERNALMQRVYPKLAELCRDKYGLEFQVSNNIGRQNIRPYTDYTQGICLSYTGYYSY